MNKSAKLVGSILLGLGVLSIILFFVFNRNSDYTVTFDTDGGTALSSVKVPKGNTLGKPEDPEKAGHAFIKWQLDGVDYDFDMELTHDITLKAIWKKLTFYNVTINLEGKDYKKEVIDGEIININDFEFPYKEGYVVRLYQNDELWDMNTEVKNNLSLTGKYDKLKTFTVKFDSNGGSKVNSVTVTEGDTITSPDIERVGYYLEGWCLNDNVYDFELPVTNNITLKAKWEKE